MKTLCKSICLIIIISAVFMTMACGSVSIPDIFSDNMVLQQKSEITFWGWSNAGETISIKADWMDKEVTLVTGNQGKWNTVIMTPAAGGPFNIHIRGSNEIILKNILIGEVWLCSGQSNMEFSAMSGINNRDEEIKNASYPEIRLFSVYHGSSRYPQDHLKGEWSACTPETMRYFSAVGYFFARKLHKELGIPVGIINSSWGGTPAETWMPEEVIQNNDMLREAASKLIPVRWGPVEPGRLYNFMISPLIPFRIAGVLWYQGESNATNAYAYKDILSELIGSWRKKWGYDFPFYFAQIAPYKYEIPFQGVEVRDAQRRALEISNTGMIVLSDIGDTTDIHPRNKQDVGLRFANLALNRLYKPGSIEDSGPLFKDMVIDKNKAVITFDHSEGLHAKGDKVCCFEIAGEDKVFYPARATIKGRTVVVSSDKVKVPLTVRFAWSNTATPNLFNSANLPASCFITK